MSAKIIRTITLTAGKIAVEVITARIFRVISSTGTFSASFDGGDAIPMSKARGIGSPTSPQFERIVFTDTSGSANTITFYAGDEPITVEETQTVTLDSDSVTAINPGRQTLSPGHDRLSNSAFTYMECTAIKVINIGGVNITVNSEILEPGEDIGWSVFRHQDIIDDVTVDCTGGDARVIYQ